MAEPNIFAVAKEAGVSIATVSRALTGKTGNADTIAAVRAAAERVGYRPNAAGQSLRSKRTGQILLAVSDIGNAAYLDMMRAIEPLAHQAGFRLILQATHGDAGGEADLVTALDANFADGVILTPLRLSDRLIGSLQQSRVPVTVVANLPADTGLDCIRTDSREGARVAVEHLMGRGCDRIGFLGGPPDTGPGQSRRLGYQDALLEVGQDAVESRIEVSRSFKFAEGRDAARVLLEREPDLDGVLAANDHLALGVLHAAAERRRHVPRDLRVVGMDNGEAAETALPGLTSVDLQAHNRGAEAFATLLRRMEDPDLPAQDTLLGPRLVVRDSS